MASMSELSIEIDDHIREAIKAARSTGMTRLDTLRHLEDRVAQIVLEVTA